MKTALFLSFTVAAAIFFVVTTPAGTPPPECDSQLDEMCCCDQGFPYPSYNCLPSWMCYIDEPLPTPLTAYPGIEPIPPVDPYPGIEPTPIPADPEMLPDSRSDPSIDPDRPEPSPTPETWRIEPHWKTRRYKNLKGDQ